MPTGYFIGSLWTVPKNNVKNNSPLYRISSNPSISRLFSINYTTGDFYIAARIDREELATSLKAYDNGSIDLSLILIALNQPAYHQTNYSTSDKMYSSTFPLIINVNILINDINDNSPTFPTNIQVS